MPRLRKLSRAARRIARRLRRLPPAGWVLLATALFLVTHLVYQVARKPSELVAAVAPSQAKTPEATWSEYHTLFEAHSTQVVAPELLAALAQAESAGDPLATTYWQWRWRWNPLDLRGPASSAVGLLQMTDGNFAEARRLCIHHHAVAREGAWYDPRACWFNGLYFRTFPSHAIEMTSAWLDLTVSETLAGGRVRFATLEDRRRLAAVVHLCGRERGAAFVAHGFRVLPGERCGEHDLGRWLARVEALRATFARLAAK